MSLESTATIWRDGTPVYDRGENVCVIDTGCGKGGFLTVLELPAVKVYESRP